jgi:crotonobetainyl-CoA:carnitine CoA-transferase CaiB-like acyl-CoA transferase
MNFQSMAPLARVTVLDLTELLPGPYATLLMQQLGATVIKVEKPAGDAARVVSPGMFRVLNQGKETIQVDLKSVEGLQVMEDLVRCADVLIESFRPGVLDRLGLSTSRLVTLNERIVVVSLTGYGQSGPRRDDPGHDINYAALAGLVSISAPRSDAPSYDVGLPVADLAGSMFVLTAVLGGLLDREKTGRGNCFDVSMADCLLHWMSPRIGARQSATEREISQFASHLHTRPAYGLFRASCGRWIALGALETSFWKRVVSVLELSEFSDEAFDSFDYRCKHEDAISSALQQRFENGTVEYWMQILRDADIPATPVNDLDAALLDPHFVARGMPTSDGGVRFPVFARGPIDHSCARP